MAWAFRPERREQFPMYLYHLKTAITEELYEAPLFQTFQIEEQVVAVFVIISHAMPKNDSAETWPQAKTAFWRNRSLWKKTVDVSFPLLHHWRAAVTSQRWKRIDDAGPDHGLSPACVLPVGRRGGACGLSCWWLTYNACALAKSRSVRGITGFMPNLRYPTTNFLPCSNMSRRMFCVRFDSARIVS